MGRQFFEPWLQNHGRNGWDQPQAIPNDMSAESYNIELREGGLGKKRSGSERVTLSAGPSSAVGYLGKYIPSNDIGQAELWFNGISGGVYHLYRLPGTSASAVDLGSPYDQTNYAQLNNKFFVASNQTSNRIQVYDPNQSTTSMRYVGLSPEAAPSVANTGAGTYPAIPRSYRVVTRIIIGGVVQAQSEPSATVAFTPSGGGTAARVTKAATADGETHWAVQAASANGVWWELSGSIAVATTTYDDSVEPQNYPSVGTVPPLTGSNYPFPSVRYLISDGIRLLGLGVYETTAGVSVTPMNGRLYFTPAFGSSDMGDDERIVDTSESSGWIDLAVGGGGADRGLGLVNNAVFAFQYNGVFQFMPTGNADVPFRRVVLDPSVGSVSGASIVHAKDKAGNPALYFLDPLNGPYRVTTGYVLEWIGRDVKDIWDTADTGTVSFETFFRGVFDSSRNLIIWTLRTTSATTRTIVFDVTNGEFVGNNEVRKGWAEWSNLPGDLGVMFPNALTVPRPFTQRLYMGSTTAAVHRCDPTLTQDNAVNYQAYVRSKAYRWAPSGRLKKLLEAVIVAKARAATTIRALFIPNLGENSGLTQDVSIAAVGSSTYVRPRPNPEDMTDLWTVQAELGDAAAANNSWEIESMEMQVEILEDSR